MLATIVAASAKGDDGPLTQDAIRMSPSTTIAERTGILPPVACERDVGPSTPEKDGGTAVTTVHTPVRLVAAEEGDRPDGITIEVLIEARASYRTERPPCSRANLLDSLPTDRSEVLVGNEEKLAIVNREFGAFLLAGEFTIDARPPLGRERESVRLALLTPNLST